MFKVLINPFESDEFIPLIVLCQYVITMDYFTQHGMLRFTCEELNIIASYDLRLKTMGRRIDAVVAGGGYSTKEAMVFAAEDFLAHTLKLEPAGDEALRRN